MTDLEAVATAQAIADKLIAANEPRFEGGEGAPEEQNNKRKFGGGEDDPQAKRSQVNGDMQAEHQGSYNQGQQNIGVASGEQNRVQERPGSFQQLQDGKWQEIIDVPQQLLGKLIGRKGETIRVIESNTQSKIQADHKEEGDPKKVTITGATSEIVRGAKALIKDVLENDQNIMDVKREVDCPQQIVGRIIGKGGDTIRALQLGSGAKIMVIQDNIPEGQPRRVVINGPLDAVTRAEKMVMELIQGEPGSVHNVIMKYGQGICREIDCPKRMVGKLIGKKGETIIGIQKRHGANIQIKQDEDPCKVVITGVKQNVENAQNEVKQIIQGTNQHDLQSGYGGRDDDDYSNNYGQRGGPGMHGGQGSYQPHSQGAFQAPNTYPPQASYGGPVGYPTYPAGVQGQPYPGYGTYGQGYRATPGTGAYGAPGMAPSGYGGGYGADPYAAQGYPQQAPGGYAAQPPNPIAQPVVDWQELQDDKGNPYYYNNKTGVSQWEKPPELM